MSKHLFIFLTVVSLTTAYPQYQDYIPNGGQVPDPCQPNTTWPGVGHKNKGGGGDRNPFGLDFAANNHVWTKKLCNKDSDGDGRTNGQELGDPNCTWTSSSGKPPAFTTGLTHPGICEQISSQKCMMLNTWLSCKMFSCPAFSKPYTKNITVKFARTAVPVKETTVMCQQFKVPNDKKYHIVGFKSAVNNTNLTHHVILFGCPNGKDASESFTTPRPCTIADFNCKVPLFFSGPFVPGICYGDQYGIPMGKTGFQFFVVQVHWNNPMLLQNQYDSSGITIFYTARLRPNDGQLLMSGQTYINIPPHQARVHVSGSCSGECTKFMPHNVSIGGAALHMHLLGTAGDIKLIGSNGSKTILNAPHYDFRMPIMKIFDTPIPFSPGDEVTIDCVYNSLDRNTTTKYGPATSDEMCFGFVMIYPAIPLFDICYQYSATTTVLEFCPILGW